MKSASVPDSVCKSLYASALIARVPACTQRCARPCPAVPPSAGGSASVQIWGRDGRRAYRSVLYFPVEECFFTIKSVILPTNKLGAWLCQ